jgi:hypothetical protein
MKSLTKLINAAVQSLIKTLRFCCFHPHFLTRRLGIAMLCVALDRGGRTHYVYLRLGGGVIAK